MGAHDNLYNCYVPPKELFVRGEGAYLYTDKDEKYLDFIAGISVNCLGHNHPVPINALKEQADKVWHLSGMYRLKGAEELSKKYCDALPFAEKVFFTNSGADCVRFRHNVYKACASSATKKASS